MWCTGVISSIYFAPSPFSYLVLFMMDLFVYSSGISGWQFLTYIVIQTVWTFVANLVHPLL